MSAMILLPLVALVAGPPAAPARDGPAVGCVSAAGLPAGLDGWAARQVVRAGNGRDTTPALPIGRGVVAMLRPTVDVAYGVPPGKAGDDASSGGLFAFTAPTAGRYRVALGTAAWIDVLRDVTPVATPVASVAHGHGPACSGIAKLVDFDLTPGRYRIQVAGSGPATLRMMIARVR